MNFSGLKQLLDFKGGDRDLESVRPKTTTPSGTARSSGGLGDIDNAQMPPQLRSRVMQLVDELDRLQGELSLANERVVELETIADEDPLVPVLNRRSFVRELERALAYVARYKTSASLVYCDLDDFKGVNDRHGHAAGDAALQFFAHFLLDSVRKSDLVGRLGGDEFAIVLHHADEKAALEKAHRLADRLAKQSVQHNGQTIALAMSTGTTELKREDGAGDVLERADSAMYAAKTKNKRKKSATKLQAERQ